jgi:hypothetical protein
LLRWVDTAPKRNKVNGDKQKVGLRGVRCEHMLFNINLLLLLPLKILIIAFRNIL